MGHSSRYPLVNLRLNEAIRSISDKNKYSLLELYFMAMDLIGKILAIITVLWGGIPSGCILDKFPRNGTL